MPLSEKAYATATFALKSAITANPEVAALRAAHFGVGDVLFLVFLMNQGIAHHTTQRAVHILGEYQRQGSLTPGLLRIIGETTTLASVSSMLIGSVTAGVPLSWLLRWGFDPPMILALPLVGLGLAVEYISLLTLVGVCFGVMPTPGRDSHPTIASSLFRAVYGSVLIYVANALSKMTRTTLDWWSNILFVPFFLAGGTLIFMSLLYLVLGGPEEATLPVTNDRYGTITETPDRG